MKSLLILLLSLPIYLKAQAPDFSVDELTNDTTFYFGHSFYRISKSKQLSSISFRLEDLPFFTHVKIGDKAIIKFADSSFITLLAPADLTAQPMDYPQSQNASTYTRFRSAVTSSYQLSGTDIETLKSKPVIFIRVYHSNGYKDWKFTGWRKDYIMEDCRKLFK